MAQKKAESEPIVIQALNFKNTNIPVIGETELIVHNWSDKAKKMMLDKQMGKATPKKDKKDPDADYLSSIYFMPDGTEGFPSVGFKAAIVGACRQFENLPMTVAKVAVRVNGELTQIVGANRMREDMVRLQTGVADIRYRAGYPRWKAMLNVTYNASIISDEMLINLVNAAGFGGIGEWRPSAPKSHTGSFGCFRVANLDEWEKYE